MSNLNNIGNITSVYKKNHDVIYCVEIIDSEGREKRIEIIPGIIYDVKYFNNGKQITITGKYIGANINDQFDENSSNFNEKSYFLFDISIEFNSNIHNINIMNIVDIDSHKSTTVSDKDKVYTDIIGGSYDSVESYILSNNSETIFIDPITSIELKKVIDTTFIRTNEKLSIIVKPKEDINCSDLFSNIKDFKYIFIVNESYIDLAEGFIYKIEQRDTVILITELVSVS